MASSGGVERGLKSLKKEGLSQKNNAEKKGNYFVHGGSFQVKKKPCSLKK